MSSSKKEVIVGAIIVIIISLWLTNVGMMTTETNIAPLLSLSASQNNVISWVATLGAIFSVASGLWLISQSDKPAIKKWIERYTLRASIPGYFLYALIPMIAGFLLLFLLGQTTWGFGLACTSVPLTIIFLIFGLRKKD